MTSSLVGSEMCIRDSGMTAPSAAAMRVAIRSGSCCAPPACVVADTPSSACLLYTSDAADDM
eukprot:10580642-Prorocentrum_lima.AAC.1